MKPTDFIYAGFTNGGGTTTTPNWKLISNTPEDKKKALEDGYDAFSIMSVSHDSDDKEKPVPLRKGPLVLDFDKRDEPETAIKCARYFIWKLIYKCNLDPDCLQFWLSGKKGCHIAIPASILGSEEGHQYLHEIYKFLVFFLQKLCFGGYSGNKVIDMQMYCGGKGRLLREENILRKDNGKYKVPVTSKEFLEEDIDTLLALTSSPRETFERGHKCSEANTRLADLFQMAKDLVECHSVANVSQILEAMNKCALFRKCVEEAETLEEPAWWACISELAHLQNVGRRISHLISCGYAGYSTEETDKKFNEAVKAGKPISCAYIREQGLAQCPDDCHMRFPKDLFKVKNVNSQNSSFVHQEDGLFYNEGERLTKICSPIKVIARACDFDNWNWSRVAEITDQMEQAKRIIIPMTDFADTGNKWLSSLLSAGLVLESYPKAKSLLKEYIEHGEIDCDLVRICDKIGWLPGGGYLLPDDCYGSENKVLFTGNHDSRFQISGTLEEWQEQIGKYCAGNPLLVLATAYALTGITLDLMGIEGGGLHIYGGSSKGKSTIALVAGSVCGGGKDGFIHQWRTTDNALEKVAASHNNNLLVLDEVSQVSSYALSNLAYMLPNQKGKLRMRADGQNRKQSSWNLNFLSTGELTIADKIMEDCRLKSYAGQEVRIIDLPVDGGQIYEDSEYQHPFLNLHDAPTPGKLSDILKRNALAYYGSPMRSFLTKLHADKDSSIMTLRKVMEGFEKYMPKEAGGQVQRALKKFALIAGTGELAIDMGIFPYEKGEVIKSAREWFNTWVQQRNGTEDAEILNALKRLGEHFATSAGLYIDRAMTEGGYPIPPRINGYRYEKASREVFFILSEPLRALIRNVSLNSIKHKLDELQCMDRTKEGKPKDSLWIGRGNVRGLAIIPENLPTL